MSCNKKILCIDDSIDIMLNKVAVKGTSPFKAEVKMAEILISS